MADGPITLENQETEKIKPPIDENRETAQQLPLAENPQIEKPEEQELAKDVNSPLVDEGVGEKLSAIEADLVEESKKQEPQGNEFESIENPKNDSDTGKIVDNQRGGLIGELGFLFRKTKELIGSYLNKVKVFRSSGIKGISGEQQEVFEKELKLKETWKKWIKETCPIIQQRAKCYGFEESIAAEIEGNIGKSFEEDLRTVTNPKKMEKLRRESFKAIDNLAGEVNKPELKNLLGQLSKKDILDLLNRKLEGKITPKEKKILDIFSEVNSGGATGRYDPFSGEIRIYLLDSGSLQGRLPMLMHEFTHKGLSNLEPKEVRRRKISMMLKGPPKEEKSRNFWGVLSAVDESLARRIQKYYNQTLGEPPYARYKDKIDPEIFKKFYTSIDAAAAGKSIKQFDDFAARTYVSLASKWKEDLSPEDIQKAIASTMEEINKFKEG